MFGLFDGYSQSEVKAALTRLALTRVAYLKPESLLDQLERLTGTQLLRTGYQSKSPVIYLTHGI
jgi:hypothetical protein